ncbi:HAD hydrolase-like protein [Kurthia senegalensis]|uniref:HAD hydrolase-like protein n=1 Tax=Kurthia senegalensis TaxID=1033740 RepID=UPI000288C1DC|nr:HAD hydrolase-like protein [Kurthia senegalensis]
MKILWDFDGTLFDTYPVYVKTLFDVVPRLSTLFSKEQAMRAMKVSFSHGFQALGISPTEERAYREKIIHLPPEHFLPFAGVEEVLKRAELNVIMSHKERVVIEAVLQQYGFQHYFKEIVTPEMGFPRKPDAASYAYLNDRYALDLAIGDRELDLVPAKAIGLKTVMFQGDCASADYSLRTYEEFETHVKPF